MSSGCSCLFVPLTINLLKLLDLKDSSVGIQSNLLLLGRGLARALGSENVVELLKGTALGLRCEEVEEYTLEGTPHGEDDVGLDKSQSATVHV